MATYRANYSPGNWIVVAGPNLLVLLEPDLRRAAPKLERIWSDVNTCTTLDELVSSLVQWGPETSAVAIFQVIDNRLRLTYRGQAVILDANSGATVADGGGSPVWRTVEPSTPYIQVNLGPEALVSQRVPLLMGIVGASSFTLDARIGATEPRRPIVRPGTPPPAPASEPGANNGVLNRFGLHGLLGIAQPLDGWEVPSERPAPAPAQPAWSVQPPAAPAAPAAPSWSAEKAWDAAAPTQATPAPWTRNTPAPAWPADTAATPDWPTTSEAPAWPATTEPAPTQRPASAPAAEATGMTASEAAWMAALDGLRAASPTPTPPAQPAQPEVDDWPISTGSWPVPPAAWPTRVPPATPDVPASEAPATDAWSLAQQAWPTEQPAWPTTQQNWPADLDVPQAAEVPQPDASDAWGAQSDAWNTPAEPAATDDWNTQPEAEPAQPDAWMTRAFAPAADKPAPAAAPATPDAPAYTLTDIEEATQKLIDQLAQPLIADWMVEPFSPAASGVDVPHATTREAGEPTALLGGEPAAPAVPVTPRPSAPAAPSLLAPDWEAAPILSFGEGMDVPIDGVVIIGRAPVAGAQEHARLIKISSSTHGLSRSHVRIEPIEATAGQSGFLVTDLRSTNGTEIEVPGGELVPLDPDAPQVVPMGTLIRLGGTIEARIDAQ